MLLERAPAPWVDGSSPDVSGGLEEVEEKEAQQQLQQQVPSFLAQAAAVAQPQLQLQPGHIVVEDEEGLDGKVRSEGGWEEVLAGTLGGGVLVWQSAGLGPCTTEPWMTRLRTENVDDAKVPVGPQLGTGTQPVHCEDCSTTPKRRIVAMTVAAAEASPERDTSAPPIVVDISPIRDHSDLTWKLLLVN